VYWNVGNWDGFGSGVRFLRWVTRKIMLSIAICVMLRRFAIHLPVFEVGASGRLASFRIEYTIDTSRAAQAENGNHLFFHHIDSSAAYSPQKND